MTGAADHPTPAGGFSAEERAWIVYRDDYQRERPWADARRLSRQTRKRDFIAGYLAARADRLDPGGTP